MIAEVISIGDELTSGQRLDTNSQWLSERLGELGIRVLYHTTVADDLAANVAVFRQAVERADVVVATGGLGPTADDLTREALAAVAGVDLVLDEAALAHIRALFRFLGRDMPERNRVQALFPRGSRIIANPHGTAPGIELAVPRASGAGSARIFALPGVPSEMHEMWRDSVAAAISGQGPGRVIRHHRIKCFGVGESHLEQMLPDLIRRGREPSVGITVSDATITLRITTSGPTPDDCLAAMQPTIATIQECLGELIFGTEDEELHHAVARLLVERGLTLATAEWGTGGLVAHWMNDRPNVGGPYLGGQIVASEAALEPLLGIGSDVVARYGFASGELVRVMAESCRARSGADLALAVSPLPDQVPANRIAAAVEPESVGQCAAASGGAAGDRVEAAGRPSREARSRGATPRVYFALATPGETIVRSAPFAGHPSLRITRTAKQAVNLVRLWLVRGGAETSGETEDRT